GAVRQVARGERAHAAARRGREPRALPRLRRGQRRERRRGRHRRRLDGGWLTGSRSRRGPGAPPGTRTTSGARLGRRARFAATGPGGGRRTPRQGFTAVLARSRSTTARALEASRRVPGRTTGY